jgi:uncharacterized protein Yka (UPF0111/DUF47 family)
MWLDRAVKWLLPREEHFFDLLEKGSASVLRSGELLVTCCESQTAAGREEAVAKMTDEEHASDRVIREVYEALNKTFVTPLDRSDIYALATDLENVVDRCNGTIMQIVVHAMEDLPPGSVELAAKVNVACQEIDAAVKLLRNLKQTDAIQKHCKALVQLEHDGDQIFRAHIGEMYRTEKDAVRLLKHKEFLEGLENTLDACDDVANALEALVIKNA